MSDIASEFERLLKFDRICPGMCSFVTAPPSTVTGDEHSVSANRAAIAVAERIL
jgi:hypothetical protein